jgi:hypothetical protein
MVLEFSALQSPQGCQPLPFLGTMCSAEDQELGFGDFEPVRCQSTWSAGDWCARCSPDVVDCVVAHLSLHACGTNEVRKLGEKSVGRCTPTDGLGQTAM